MKLTLENIGKVKHAEINVRKNLIVPCGSRNIGKTDTADRVDALGETAPIPLRFRDLNAFEIHLDSSHNRFFEIIKENLKGFMAAFEFELVSGMQRLFAASKGALRDAGFDRSFGKLENAKLNSTSNSKVFFHLQNFRSKKALTSPISNLTSSNYDAIWCMIL